MQRIVYHKLLRAATALDQQPAAKSTLQHITMLYDRRHNQWVPLPPDNRTFLFSRLYETTDEHVQHYMTLFLSGGHYYRPTRSLLGIVKLARRDAAMTVNTAFAALRLLNLTLMRWKAALDTPPPPPVAPLPLALQVAETPPVPGSFLIAHPQLPSPFARTILMVVQHSARGSLALVLNTVSHKVCSIIFVGLQGRCYGIPGARQVPGD
eukprot:TRINITY_DN4080_c0_g2_i2.p1 TRINITY_DN4080_c0_g2~~TRINITY_DN4080_c0_g2_i2.p1  ORF type:complete len:209 (+),score=31.37 TRINITY_DN4080_c0_g2_i2:47-673(+)